MEEARAGPQIAVNQSIRSFVLKTWDESVFALSPFPYHYV